MEDFAFAGSSFFMVTLFEHETVNEMDVFINHIRTTLYFLIILIWFNIKYGFKLLIIQTKKSPNLASQFNKHSYEETFPFNYISIHYF